MHFMIFYLTFGICDKLWGFSKFWSFCAIFGTGFCLNVFRTSWIGLHLHFNYIFMHYRCVLYMLNGCVIRFGLCWAHDAFYVTYHMLMHFHTYELLILYILLLILFGAFLRVSLASSLFLALVCFVETKPKSTPSQNLLHSRASSSSPSDPTPSHVKFRDDKAHKDFSENFSWQGIHSKRQVVLSNFFDTDLPTVIYSQDWESLCDIPVTCPSVIVQEFYSNMHRFDYSAPLFVTRVRGTCIVFTSDIISEVLHIPRVAHPDYPSYNRLRTMSKDELSSLFCATPSS